MKRRGMAIVEVLVAGVVLAAMMTIALQMFAATAAQRRAARDQLTATQEAANVMERLAAVPWDTLTEDGTAGVELSGSAGRALPEVKLEIEITASPGEADALAAKRIGVIVSGQERNGHARSHTRLVAWRYRP